MPPNEPNSTPLKLSLSGPITLYESLEVRETLRAALAEKRDLRVDLDASGPWDLAGLQLLVSLANTAHKAGLSVRLVHVPGVCREVAERSGLGPWLERISESFG
jgi:ABC-type transporter Mla MlaB component